MKYQLFLQSRSAECGLACAAMILRRLGIDTDLHRLRTQYEIGRDGMSTTAIRFLLLDFNVPSFQHKGRVRVIGEALKQGKQVMVHVDGDHFCLVESVDSRWVRLADPGRGRVKMSREDAIRKIGRTWWIMPDAGMSTAFRRARLMCRDLRTSPSLRIVKRTLVSRPWLLLGVFALSLTLLAASGGAPLVISALVNSLQGKSAAPTQATALMLAAAIVTFIGLDVPPRWVYRYTLIWPGDAAPMRGLGHLFASILRQTLVEVRITPVQGFTDPDDGVGLVLLYHPSRLPLSPDDGQAVPLYRRRPTGGDDQEGSLVVPLPPHGQELSLWFKCSGLAGGYLRLAVNSSVSSQIDQEYSRRALEHYALIDPELSLLFRQP